METGNKWGLGPNGKGENDMGRIKESIRSRIKQTPQTGNINNVDSQSSDCVTKELIRMSHSILNGIDNCFDINGNIRVKVVIFNGKMASYITDHIDNILIGKKPTASHSL